VSLNLASKGGVVRKTIIFGNGLGMALDPNYFSLDRAIGEVWADDAILDDVGKTLIKNCLPDQTDARPHGEDDLDTLQVALSACELLSRIGEDRIHWLSEHGKHFPEAIRRFIYHTAHKFHGHQPGLPAEFIEPLVDFVKATQSHIATLNYDNLLYQPLIENEVLKGYDGYLVDGFLNAGGFAIEHVERKYKKTFGYYMHLHGSPLFVNGDDGHAHKMPQAIAGKLGSTESSHIVLTHFKHKPTVIAASDVLSAYWKLLEAALLESDGIVIVGYSGLDTHLNDLISGYPQLPIRVVEWSGAGNAGARHFYWDGLFPKRTQLTSLDSILSFKDWGA